MFDEWVFITASWAEEGKRKLFTLTDKVYYRNFKTEIKIDNFDKKATRRYRN